MTANIVEITGAEYPQEYKGHKILPMEGTSLLPALSGEELDRGPLFFEHEGNATVRMGKWKLVREYPGDWELYDMSVDRTETNDLSDQYPELVKSMSEQYEEWADRCGVIPREKILQILESEGKAFWEDE